MAFPGSKRALLGSPTYIGPGDIVPGAAAWYGLRAYSSSVVSRGTQKAVNIRRASDNATMDILILKNGALDIVSASAFLSGTTGFVTKAHDQTGNGRDASQATAANQPQLFLSGGIGNGPYISSTGATQTLNGPSITPATGIVSFSAVANRASGTTTTGFMAETINHNRLRVSSAGNWDIASGTNSFTAPAADAAWHTGNAVINGASSILMIDGASTTGTVTVDTTGAASFFAGSAAGDTVYTVEGGFWDNLALTSTQLAALNTNQKARWPGL